MRRQSKRYILCAIPLLGIGAKAAAQSDTHSVAGIINGGGSSLKVGDIKDHLITMTNDGADLFLIAMAAVGIVLVGISLAHMYKASKDERQPAKQAFVGLFIGGALTTIAPIVGAMRSGLIAGV